jgi:hypothetical protein
VAVSFTECSLSKRGVDFVTLSFRTRPILFLFEVYQVLEKETKKKRAWWYLLALFGGKKC